MNQDDLKAAFEDLKCCPRCDSIFEQSGEYLVCTDNDCELSYMIGSVFKIHFKKLNYLLYSSLETNHTEVFRLNGQTQSTKNMTKIMVLEKASSPKIKLEELKTYLVFV